MSAPTVRISDDMLAIALGADELAAAFESEGCKVERVSSWGMAWLEPLVEIGGLGYGPASIDQCAEILACHANGKPETAAQVEPRLRGDGKLWGEVLADHPFLTRQTRLTFARAGKTQPLSLTDYQATGGWQGLAKARQIGPEATVETILESGLRGRGGAGFPTGIKWRTVMQASAAEKYIVANADEGDSATFADRMLMEGDPFQLIEGMAIAAYAVGAAKGYVYIRSEYPQAIAKMRSAAQLCADIIAPFELEIRVGAGAYVCGEETSLLNSLEGKRGEVRAKPPLPALEGLFGQPTVVNNVLTLAAAAHILRDGAESYAKHGMGRSLGTMPVQLAGNVKHGGLFEAPFGLTLGELVNDIGGGTRSGRPVKAVQVGGPLGAYLHPNEFDLPFDYEAFAAHDALIGHAGITVFDDSVHMAEMARFAMEFCAAESCGKCTPCRIGSVRGRETLERIIAAAPRAPGRVENLPQMHNASAQPRTIADEAALIRDLCDTMKHGSLCALGGFTPYPVLSAMNKWPEDFGLPAQAAQEMA